MSISNRAARLTKTHRVLKKHFKPVVQPSRPLLEHLLYACLLENAPHQAADDAMARLLEAYYDWNEVRVTTITELKETLSCLPDPAEAATRLKRALQSVFETYYSFDLNFFAKENIGQAVKKLAKLDGVTSYTIAFVTQHALGGHAIPVNAGALEALEVLGIVSAAEAKEGRVPGLERAIPKSKGMEFASLLHQLGVQYAASRFSPRVRNLLLEIDPDAKSRLPKRVRKKAEPAEEPKAKRPARKGKSSSKAEPEKAPKPGSRKPTTAKKAAKSSKKPAASKKNAAEKSKKPRTTKKGTSKSSGRSSKSSTSRLSKKKPR